jgi:hypothetical protein
LRIKINPVQYKGLELDTELRLDVLVEDVLCIELKAQEGCQYMMLFYFHICRCYRSPKAFSSIFIASIFINEASEL